MDLFPTGIHSFLVGGLLIGTGVGAIFLTTGLVAGASSFFSTTWSWFSRHPSFRAPDLLVSRGWRLVFAVALVLGALAYTLTIGGGAAFHTAVAPWRLVLGGFLVGLGTRVSRGCTSGHGICGLSSLSFPALLAVLTFMGVAILTAMVARALGIAP